jgi:type I restriction enzyme M protein
MHLTIKSGIDLSTTLARKTENESELTIDTSWPSSGSKDESLEDSANLSAPDIIAAEIVEDLQAALLQLATIASDLK